MESATRKPLAKASVYLSDDDAPFIVTQTPREVAELVQSADTDGLIELTLGNLSDWNGKPLFIRASAVRAISPPKDLAEDDG